MNDVTNRTIAQEKKILESIGMAYKETECFLSQPIENFDYRMFPYRSSGRGRMLYFKGEKHVRACFHITQHISSLKLLEKVRELLGCGTITKKSSTVIRYQIDRGAVVTINSTHWGLADKYPLYTKKAEHYAESL